MSEVHDPRDPKDQRKATADQPIEPAEKDAGNHCLKERYHVLTFSYLTRSFENLVALTATQGSLTSAAAISSGQTVFGTWSCHWIMIGVAYSFIPVSSNAILPGGMAACGPESTLIWASMSRIAAGSELCDCSMASLMRYTATYDSPASCGIKGSP